MILEDRREGTRSTAKALGFLRPQQTFMKETG
jgi:hypothetical protein